MDRNRRALLSYASGAAVLALLPHTSHAARSAPVQLTSGLTAGSFQQFTAVIEVDGTLRLNPDGQKVTTKPIQVVADLEFDEKALAVGQRARCVRHYTKAEAAIKIDRGGLTNKLRDELRTVCIEVGEESATMYSPLGPLTRDELELLKLPADPALWQALLPTKAVQAGDNWKLSDPTLAMLLGIEVVTTNEVTAKLVQMDDKLAQMELAGAVTGAIGGVSAEFDLKAKYSFDLAKKYIPWVALGIKEKRAIGHAQPGYEITSRVRIAATPLRSSPHLADGFLAQFPLELKDGSTLLSHESTEGGFHLLHDRRWHVMADHRDATIMRMVDHGDLIAQCNISRLKNLAPDKRLSLDGFAQEVQTTLGKTLDHILDTDQSTTDQGLRQLRIVAAGTVQEVPVQWTYYHLTDDEGRSAALVYTMDSRLVERFAELDRAMVSSLELRSRAIDSAAPATANTPEKKPAAPAEQAAKPAASTKK